MVRLMGQEAVRVFHNRRLLVSILNKILYIMKTQRFAAYPYIHPTTDGVSRQPGARSPDHPLAALRVWVAAAWAAATL